MNLTALKAAVQADTFDSGTDPTDWINAKYTELCDLERWTFMETSAAVSVTNGSMTVGSLPTDFAIADALLDQYGGALEKVTDPESFYSRYTGTGNTYTGQPEAFTVHGGVVLVGPKSNVTDATFKLIYERTATLLVSGSDVPIIPVGYHMVIVAGARALGCRLYGMLADAAEADSEYRGGIEIMRRKYLRSVRDRRPQSPAYHP